MVLRVERQGKARQGSAEFQSFNKESERRRERANNARPKWYFRLVVVVGARLTSAWGYSWPVSSTIPPSPKRDHEISKATLKPRLYP
jgi:hypothetical protein